jgi:hypothetical protein
VDRNAMEWKGQGAERRAGLAGEWNVVASSCASRRVATGPAVPRRVAWHGAARCGGVGWGGVG